MDGDLASRLTLSSLLKAGGYCVDNAASAAEAVGKLDEGQFQLVLADLRTESREAGSRILAYARQKDYHPATSLITSSLKAERDSTSHRGQHVAVDDEDVSNMLDKVAELIGNRASRRANRLLRAS